MAMERAKDEWMAAALAFIEASLEAMRARLLAVSCVLRADPSAEDLRRHAVLLEMVRDQREEVLIRLGARLWEK